MDITKYVQIASLELDENTLRDVPRMPFSFLPFSLEDAQHSFIVLVKLSRKVDFYKFSDQSRDAEFADTLNYLSTQGLGDRGIKENEIKVAPTKVSGGQYIGHLITQHIIDKIPRGETFQIYRVVVIFDSIFNVSQQCGCWGYSGYDLMKKAQPIEKQIQTGASTTRGNHVGVYVSLDNDDFNSKHGKYFIDLIKTMSRD